MESALITVNANTTPRTAAPTPFIVPVAQFDYTVSHYYPTRTTPI